MATRYRIVPGGVYFGFSLKEMLDELERYKAQVKLSADTLGLTTINGQQYQFGPRRDMGLHEWGAEIQNALALLDPDNFFAAPDRTQAAFR